MTNVKTAFAKCCSPHRSQTSATVNHPGRTDMLVIFTCICKLCKEKTTCHLFPISNAAASCSISSYSLLKEQNQNLEYTNITFVRKKKEKRNNKRLLISSITYSLRLNTFIFLQTTSSQTENLCKKETACSFPLVA